VVTTSKKIHERSDSYKTGNGIREMRGEAITPMRLRSYSTLGQTAINGILGGGAIGGG
jgi:hypothetical protein